MTRQAGIRMMRTSKPEVRARHQHHTPFSVLAFLPVTKLMCTKVCVAQEWGPGSRDLIAKESKGDKTMSFWTEGTE